MANWLCKITINYFFRFKSFISFFRYLTSFLRELISSSINSIFSFIDKISFTRLTIKIEFIESLTFSSIFFEIVSISSSPRFNKRSTSCFIVVFVLFIYPPELDIKSLILSFIVEEFLSFFQYSKPLGP